MGSTITALEYCATAPMPSSQQPLFERLLVAVDFSPASEKAFRMGVRLAKRLGTEMTLLHVFEYANTVPSDEMGELQELLTKSRCWLDKYTAIAAGEGVVCKPVLLAGFPPHMIVETAKGLGSDLIVLGTNGFRGFERFVFGSTAEAVMRSAECPVLTTGPRVRQDTDGPIVFATDFHTATRGAMGLACRMSTAINVPLHLLHVLPRAVEEGASARLVPQIIQEALANLGAEGLVERPVCAVVFGSEVSQAVVEYARQQHASAIVLGVRKLSLLASHGPAQIAYRMIAEASCPVVTSCLQA